MNKGLEFEVEHIALAARDTVRLKDWYVHTLGAEVVFQMRQEPPAFLLRMGSVVIEVYSARSDSNLTQDNGLAGWRHLALKVPDLEKARDWLAGRGVVFQEQIKPAGGGGRVLFFQDPEGNLLHLVERLPGGYQ